MLPHLADRPLTIVRCPEGLGSCAFEKSVRRHYGASLRRVPFRERTTGREVHYLVAELGLASFARTTGSKGLHVVVPIEKGRSWDEVKAFTHALAAVLAAAAPDRYTVELAKAKRGGRVFVDWLRNAAGQTAVAPYSPRARPGATVSVPLRWDEVTEDLVASRFDVLSVPARVAQTGDAWEGYANLRQSLTDRMFSALGLAPGRRSR